MAEYEFKSHEKPLMPGSPATPDHPMQRRVAYFLVGVFIATYGGLQNGLMLANLPLVQAERALTPVEGGWVKAAYYIPYACMSMTLMRTRQHLGIQFFVRLALWALLTANLVQLFVDTYWAEIVSRAFSAIAASGMLSLSVFYFMQSLPARIRLMGMVFTIGIYQLGIPLARAFSPALLVSGDVKVLFTFQFALTLVIAGLVNLIPIPPGRKIKVFRKLDLISFPLLAGGLGLLFAFLIQGTIIWWDKAWLGYALAASLLMIGLSLMIEHYRARPMIEVRWLANRDVILLALSGVTARLVMSEQNYGSIGFLTMIGMSSDQLVTFNWVLVGATVAAIVASLWTLNMNDLKRPVVTSFGLITLAAFADMHSGLETRPQDFYVTQAIAAFASVYFLGSVMVEGMVRAMVRGPSYIVSFIAVFSLGQTLGAYIGSALLFTFQTFRTKAHLMDIAQRLSLSDPAVAQQVAALARGNAVHETDPVLQGANGMSSLVHQATIQAQVQAYNDGFFLMGCVAGIVFLATLYSWLSNRRRGIIPHAQELQALQDMIARNR